MNQYFAYGSNLDEDQMNDRCPGAKAKGVIRLDNYEFFIDTRGVASIRPNKGKAVYGLRYDISDKDEESLDRHEGVPKCYTKTKLPEIGCFCYVSTSPQGNIPRPGYVEKIIKAAENHKLPEQYINELKSWVK